MQRTHVKIYGTVQGIFFRKFIKLNADKFNIKGYAKNVNDHVEAIFEGTEESIQKLLQTCKLGPPGSKIQDIKIEKEKYTGEFRDFSIKY